MRAYDIERVEGCHFLLRHQRRIIKTPHFTVRITRACMKESKKGVVCVRDLEVNVDGDKCTLKDLTPEQLLGPRYLQMAILAHLPQVKLLPGIDPKYWPSIVDFLLEEFSQKSYCSGLNFDNTDDEILPTGTVH